MILVCYLDELSVTMFISKIPNTLYVLSFGITRVM